ncbi:TolC family protein [Pseudomonas aeruginosa]|nr:TolC family protein [Pseudomonas aeruginosa]
MAPPDATPPLPVPNAWLDVSTRPGSVGRQATELAWDQYFADPLLRQLIATALENNKDLRSAVLRVEEARAAFRIQRSESFPGIGVGGKAARSRVPADLNPPGVPQVGGEYRAEVGLSSWELDLWGRIRSLNRSALESWLATDAAHQAVRIALITQVADGYLGLRELDDRVAIAQQTVASREESYRIFERRYQVGSTSKLALTQVQTLLNQAKSLQVQLAKQRANQYHALAQLLGSGTDLEWPVKQMPEPADFIELTPGLPSGYW